VAYQTAYLKAYYPVEFMAALLTYEMGDTDKVVEYIGECKEMGIDVLPPDINESFNDFTVVYNKDNTQNRGVIRFGLTAVKGVGGKAVEQIILAREKVGRFRSLYHFCETADLRSANKQVMEALIKAGAFDRMGGSRAQMIAGLEKAMQIGSRMQADAHSGQLNFFSGDAANAGAEHQTLPQTQPWTEMQMLTYEKEVLGFFVTKNPLSEHATDLDAYSNTNTSELTDRREGYEVVIGGMVARIRNIVTKKGKTAGAKMAVFELEDLQGKCEVVVFPKTLEQCGSLLTVDRILFVKGTVDTKRETPNIICDELIALEDVREKIAAKVTVQLKGEEVTEELISRLRNLCGRHRGKSPLQVSLTTPNGYRIRAVADRSLSVRPDAEFCEKLRSIVGRDRVVLGRR
jgi:DNA polymerase-3 subunit alpha